MPSISLRVVLAIVTLLLLVSPGGAGSLDFNETIFDLEEGSTLNYSTGVESSESLQLVIYICITKNSSASYEDFDLNTFLSIGDCVICDSRQNCAHQFNSSAINVTINRLQNDSIQWITFFKESISLDDDGTKMICAYEAGNITVPYCWIYLDINLPENPINLLVLVATSSSAIVALFVILFTVVIIRRRKRYRCELIPLQGVLLYRYK
jgi:hypothetical protein